MSEILIAIGLILAIYLLIHIIGVVADGRFMDWTEHYKSRWKLSDFVAGETIQALGTSAPEIAISFIALYIFQENPALGLATIIGSAVFQITVVIGIPLLFAKPGAKINAKSLFRTAIVYGGSVLLLYLFLQTGKALAGWELLILAAYHIIYVSYLIVTHPKGPSHTKTDEEILQEQEEKDQEIQREFVVLRWIDQALTIIPIPGQKFAFIGPIPFGFVLTLIIIGVASLYFIEAATEFAQIIGISSNLIALTVLAGGSSVPELFSNIPLAKKGNIDQAIGNAFGSNTLDICISFSLIAAPFAFFFGDIQGEQVDKMIIPIIFLFAYLFIVLGLFALTKFKTHKWQGYVLNALFVIFVGVSYYFGV